MVVTRAHLPRAKRAGQVAARWRIATVCLRPVPKFRSCAKPGQRAMPCADAVTQICSRSSTGILDTHLC